MNKNWMALLALVVLVGVTAWWLVDCMPPSIENLQPPSDSLTAPASIDEVRTAADQISPEDLPDDLTVEPVTPGMQAAIKSIHGLVLEEGRETPIPDVIVEAVDHATHKNYTTKTDAHGLFEFAHSRAGAGIHHLILSKEGYAVKRERYVLAIRESLLFHMAPGGAIYGQVIRKRDKKPVRHYKIMIFQLPDFSEEKRSPYYMHFFRTLPFDRIVEKEQEVNQKEGKFQFTGLSPGHYTLAVIAEGYQPTFYNGGRQFFLSSRLTLEKGEILRDVTISLRDTGPVHFLVKDQITRQPLAGAGVSSALNIGQYMFALPETRRFTDHNGRCELQIAIHANGNYEGANIEVSKEGYAPTRLSFTGQHVGHIQLVTLGQGGKVKGKVFDDQGAPLEGAAIFVQRDQDDSPLALVHTDSGGAYETPYLEARVELDLYCYDKAFQHQIASIQLVLENGEERIVNINGPGTAAVSGTVTLLGEPCAGALVAINGEKGSSLQTDTDVIGFYRHDNLLPGEYELTISFMTRDDHEVYGDRKVRIRPNEKQVYNFDFGRRISGTVCDAETRELITEDDDMEVTARLLDGTGRGETTSSQLEEDGQFFIYLDRPGTYELSIMEGSEYYPLEKPIVLLLNEQKAENIQLYLIRDPEDGKFFIEVVDELTGEPVTEGVCTLISGYMDGYLHFDEGIIEEGDYSMGAYHFTFHSNLHVTLEYENEITPWKKEIRDRIVLKRSQAVRVIEVKPDRKGHKAGLEEGDLILRYDGTPVSNMEALGEARDAHEDFTPARLLIRRGAMELTLIAECGYLGIYLENCLLP